MKIVSGKSYKKNILNKIKFWNRFIYACQMTKIHQFGISITFFQTNLGMIQARDKLSWTYSKFHF